MKIPITTDIKHFYQMLLVMMNKFPPIKNLVPKELMVLAEIMLQNYLNKDVDRKRRHIIIFSTENREQMHKNLGMTAGSFNDYLSKLRKKKVLSKDNQLLPFLDIVPEKGEYEFLIKFKINGE